MSLDYYNPGHARKLVILPDINSVKPKDPSLFSPDYGYLGEIVEFHDNYLSRMENITGFAVNGWSVLNAKRIFNSVETTFNSKASENSKDFEIDWLIFNGNSLSVIEVGMRGESEPSKNSQNKETKEETDKMRNDIKGSERLIGKKLEQMMKNVIIIEHLLEATSQKHACINYILLFPNLTIDIIKDRIEKLHAKAQIDAKAEIDEIKRENFSLDNIVSSTKLV